MEDAKKPRVVGDIPIELINEVMSTITDPAAMLGPEVRNVALAEPFIQPSKLTGCAILTFS